MRALLAAALLLLLPAVDATTETALEDAESCRSATPDEPSVFQSSCTRGSIVCTPWYSYWDSTQGRAMNVCAM